MIPDDVKAVCDQHSKLISRALAADAPEYAQIIALAAELRLGNPGAFMAPASPEWLKNNELLMAASRKAEAAVEARFAKSQATYLEVTMDLHEVATRNAWRMVVAILVGAAMIAAAFLFGA